MDLYYTKRYRVLKNFINAQNLKADFFDENPELEYFKEYAQLIREVGRIQASQTAWAIYLLEDPSSKFYSQPRRERLIAIETEFLGVSDYPWDTFQYLIDAYPNLAMSKKKKMFKVWADKLDEMTDYMKDLEFGSEDNDKKILHIFDKADKFWQAFLSVEKKIIEEEAEQATMRGGATAGGMYKE